MNPVARTSEVLNKRGPRTEGSRRLASPLASKPPLGQDSTPTNPTGAQMKAAESRLEDPLWIEKIEPA